jgi:hypothetical protein
MHFGCFALARRRYEGYEQDASANRETVHNRSTLEDCGRSAKNDLAAFYGNQVVKVP